MRFAPLFVLMAGAAAAQSCPGEPTTKSLERSGPALAEGLTLDLVAGGDIDLSFCDYGTAAPVGFVEANPDISFELTEMDQHRLEIVVDGICDTILLVRRPDGSYVFNDDGGEGTSAALELPPGANGRVDIWVGTYGSEICQDTALTVASASTYVAPFDVACGLEAAEGRRLRHLGGDPDAFQSFAVTAGGAVSLEQCGLEVATVGGVHERPDFSIRVGDTSEFGLMFRADSDCDTVLLMRTADGQLFFNDDGFSSTEAEIELPPEITGRVDAWVGTYGGELCDAALTFGATEAMAYADEPFEEWEEAIVWGQDPTGCPITFGASVFEPTTGDDLYSPEYREISTGNAVDLVDCNFGDDLYAYGAVSAQPDLALDLGNMSDYVLDLAVESDCDTVLLVRTPLGWRYNDDFEGVDALISLDAIEGPIEVWVGTYGGESCDVGLRAETFFR